MTIEEAIAHAKRVDTDVPFTYSGLTVRVFPNDEPSDVRHRLRAEAHDRKVCR